MSSFHQYPRRRRDTRRGNYSDLRVLFLIWQQVQRLPVKPPVTLALVAAQCGLFFHSFLLPDLALSSSFLIREGCLQPHAVLAGAYHRVLACAFLHVDEQHLLYNMLSFIMKGASLEARRGSESYAWLLARLVVLCGAIHTLLALALEQLSFDREASSCAVGFSAVLFALKTIESHDSAGHARVAGWSVPMRFVSWAELVYISVLNPQASWLGHAAGILAGLVELKVVPAGRRLL